MRPIKRVAVLGAGVMGATIAAHLANAGIDVLLLDMVPRELNDAEKEAGLTKEAPRFRNRLAARGLETIAKMKPAAFFVKDCAARMAIGNFDDDLSKLKECDWVIEVVVENMAVKKKLLGERVASHLGEETILSTNTSGLSVNELAQVLPEAVRRRFLVTHFFNPPRYMRLLEIVPCRDTDPEVVSGLASFISARLGKGIVYAKDTPNFIANRIGVYSIFNAIGHMTDMGLSVEEVDSVAGPATARPKSAAFRTADLVGIDTLVHVGNNSYELLPDDEEREVFKVPPFMQQMIEAGRLGNKTKGGFFRKEKSAEGTQIYYYDYPSGEYRPAQKPKFASVQATKQQDDPVQRLQTVVAGQDPGAEFAWKNL
ncbi:MAG TPA: 3-hydroxyacyl-CoA dehydrogenase family protein, partial [Desulfuromonadales bacterium]|nr:3-hydroxyacyl-CoA dehydrogenase family protein [Desulfuromonadales bacterium]